MCLTITGKLVLPSNDIAPSWLDIAVGLASKQRWAGQTEGPMCVLAHSFIVSELCPPAYRLDGLLHDAAEAVVGDIPTTWKTDADRARECELMRRIYRDLKREWPLSAEADQAVADADWLALRAEATLLIDHHIATVPLLAEGESYTGDRALAVTKRFMTSQNYYIDEWRGPHCWWVREFRRMLS